MDFRSSDWYVDPIRPAHVQLFRLKAVLFEGRTRFQSVRIVDTDPFGRILELDGKTQSAQADEFAYHEALVHPALIAHPNPKRVLIAGGGEGATLREVLLHHTVEQVVMVDIDSELVDLCKRHLPSWSNGAFEDHRAKLVIGDAKAYMEQHPGPYDAIIIDITDPADGGPSLPLFTRSFYQMAITRLAPDGVLVSQAGPAGLGTTDVFTPICKTVEAATGNAQPYRVNVVSFGGDWGFVLTARSALPLLTRAEMDSRIAQRVVAELRLYDGATHTSMFALPKWLRISLAAERRVITQKTPVFLATV